MKTIIQTNKSADGDQSADGDKKKSNKSRQATPKKSGRSEQPQHNPELTEKSKDEQLITNVVAQLVQTRKLTE